MHYFIFIEEIFNLFILYFSFNHVSHVFLRQYFVEISYINYIFNLNSALFLVLFYLTFS
jgi:hypothetical protein